jgi:hypothetical protein
VPVHVRIVAEGRKIDVYFAQVPEPVLSVTDNSFIRGSIGVRRYATAETTPARFANIVVSEGLFLHS